MKRDPTGRASVEILPGRLAEGQAHRAGRSGAGQDASRARDYECADRAVHHPERNRMMARTKRVRRGYSAGEWGRNRVRVFPDPKTGLYQIEWRENGRRLSRSLKQRVSSILHGVVPVDLRSLLGRIPAVPLPLNGDCQA